MKQKVIRYPIGGETISETLQILYDNAIENGEIPPISPGDIAFQQFLELSNLSNREKDLIYISNFFNQAYSILHIDVNVLNKPLSPSEIRVVKEVYQKLYTLQLERLLLKDFKYQRFNTIFLQEN